MFLTDCIIVERFPAWAAFRTPPFEDGARKCENLDQTSYVVEYYDEDRLDEDRLDAFGMNHFFKEIPPQKKLMPPRKNSVG